MQMNDMIMVSIDDHMVEPPDLFRNHVPARWADRAPHVVHSDDGLDQWWFEGELLSAPMGLNAVVSWPHDEYGWDPCGYAEIRPGAYDIHQRVRDMDRNGVFQSMCFPTMIGTNGRVFLDPADREISLVMLKAYNDWHVDEWCAAYPGRFIPLGNLPLWDPQLAAEEVRRLADKGCRAISFPEAPHVLGLPSFFTDHWDPMLAAMCDVGAVLNLHIGVGQRALTFAPEVPIDHPTFIGPMVCGMLTATDLIWGPALRNFPDLKVALSEGGIGWLSFFLERIDRHHRIQTWTHQDFGGKRPSDVLREHILACFISDPAGLRSRHEIGVDLLAWEADYPHSDGSWPNSPEELWQEFTDTGCTPEEINKITYENVARFYDYDPFAVIKKADATVGALRARAVDVDVSETTRAEYRRRYELAGSAPTE